MAHTRKGRRSKLQERLEQDPFLTDQQLADEFHVSIATIRLDRMALGIPELRVRTRDMAAAVHGKVRSMHGQEIFGELVQLDLGRQAVSVLAIEDEMVFERSSIVRGHHLFAQGNSLAAALVNSEQALTKSAQIHFHRAVFAEQRVICQAKVKAQQGSRFIIAVESRVDGQPVFSGQFVVVDVSEKEGDPS